MPNFLFIFIFLDFSLVFINFYVLTFFFIKCVFVPLFLFILCIFEMYLLKQFFTIFVCVAAA